MSGEQSAPFGSILLVFKRERHSVGLEQDLERRLAHSTMSSEHSHSNHCRCPTTPLLLLLAALLCFQSISGVQGFSIPSGLKKPNFPEDEDPYLLYELLRRKRKTHDLPNPSDRSQAAQAMISCGKVAIISGVLDIALLSLKRLPALDAAKVNVAWLASLYTFWKLSFAMNLFKVSNATQDLPTKINDQTELREGIRENLNTMKWVWRECAALVALATTVSISLAWKETIPKVREIIVGVIAVTIIGTTIFSGRETMHLTSATTGDKDDDSLLRDDTRTTCRSMALCTSIMMIRAASLPVLAIADGPLGVKSILSCIPTVATPLGIALDLRKVRKAIIVVMTELITSRRKETLKVEEEAEQNLRKAQTAFYKGVRKAFIVETVTKLLATVGELRN